MGRRKIKAFLWTRTDLPDLAATVYRDSDTREYVVDYHEGKNKIGDSFHDDLQDAEGTANAELSRMGKTYARKLVVNKRPGAAQKRVTKKLKAARQLSEAEIAQIRQSAAEWRARAESAAGGPSATAAMKKYRASKRRKNAVPPQEEINRYVAKMDREILYATGAYGRKPTVKDWRGGKDFMVVEAGPMWPGGTYFSIRDVEQIYGLGYRKIVFGGTEGFDVDLVME